MWGVIWETSTFSASVNTDMTKYTRLTISLVHHYAVWNARHYRPHPFTDLRKWGGKLSCTFLVPPHSADRNKWRVTWNDRTPGTRLHATGIRDNNGESVKTATCWILFCVCAIALLALQRASYRLARRRRTGVRAHGKVTAALASQQ